MALWELLWEAVQIIIAVFLSLLFVNFAARSAGTGYFAAKLDYQKKFMQEMYGLQPLGDEDNAKQQPKQ
jgi:hypothetical protein